MADVSPAPGGRKILGLRPRTAMIVLGVTVVAAAGYFLLKRRKSSASNAAASASASTGGYGIDYGGQLSTIQSELEDLLAAQGRDTEQPDTGSSAPGVGGGGGNQNCPPGLTWDAAKGKCVPASTSGGGDNDGGGGGGKPKPGMPTAVHPTRTTSNAVTLAWLKAPNATSYRVRATYQNKLVGSQQSVNGTSATVSGLHPDHTYTFHVAAIGPGGTSAETNGPAVKTTR